MINFIPNIDLIIMFSILIPFIIIGLRKLLSKEKSHKINTNDRIILLIFVLIFILLNGFNFFYKK
jgi:hypothetical protein